MVGMSTAIRPATEVDETRPDRYSAANCAFLVLIAVYAIARILQIYPRGVSLSGVVALHVLPTAIFAVVHGARFYRWSGILTFLGIVLVLGNMFENLGVRTGFPFGRYFFSELMGPKVLAVPVLLGLAYVGMSYFSWTLARLIVERRPTSRAASGMVLTPVLAAFIMAAWDLSQDPVWSTILHLWIWPDGGRYFGVPLTNFFGWYLTGFVIFQAFALYLRRHNAPVRRFPESYWLQPVLFYAFSAAGNVLLLLPNTRPSVVTDPAGITWKVSHITATCALITILTMGFFALLAGLRVGKRLERNRQNCTPEPARNSGYRS